MQLYQKLSKERWIEMKNYTTPTLKIEKFETVDVITTSTAPEIPKVADIQGTTVEFLAEWIQDGVSTVADLLRN